MKFSSTTEYIHKLQSICYALMLFPLVTLAVLSLIPFATPDIMLVEPRHKLMFNAVVITGAIVILTIVHLVTRQRLIKVRMLSSLADRLDGFAHIVISKVVGGVLMSTLFLAAFWIFDDYVFIVGFFAALLYAFLQKPGASSIATALKLKGTERQLVLTGKLD